MIDVNQVRKLFPVTKKRIYLLNGGLSVCSTPVKQALQEFISELQFGFDSSLFEKWTSEANDANRLFAELIGSKADEVVGIPNATTGTNLIAYMIEPERGSNVVVTDLEYPTNTYPWLLRKKRGIELRFVKNVEGKIDTRDIEKAVDEKTAVVAVSHVSCWNGFRHDLKALSEIAHDNGAFLVVDASQSAGAVDLDVKRDDVDFLVGTGSKWLLGLPGSGFLYIRKDLIEKFDPPMPGWASVTNSADQGITSMNLPKTASRFETGLRSLMCFKGTRAGLQLIHKLGIKEIEMRILSLTKYLIENLSDLGVHVFTPLEQKLRAGIVTLILKNAEEVYATLLKKSIITYLHPKWWTEYLKWQGDGIRVDPSFYNTTEELDALLNIIKTTMQSQT